ncbi:ABC transporter ATP-binding protein [Angustibacter sp. Root456]|uniref:ABC transporter ATP-binding protein n=1 Tax=Angustibacter sp. Root456 TaxID=1736539 RepID=UPI00070058EA|nr:ATP-binding cassette domain-containing protein [Angustibacter sp. Root456]KQX64382.1 ABC transporter ATP-binding protein [Angustibacter sp. Root456]
MTVTTAASAMRAEGLTKSFGATRAVDHLSLTLSPGVVGLLGPNGAGKTTLLRMLATVLAPDDGSLTLLGRDPSRPAERLEIRRRLGYLPQSPALYPGFTAFDLVDYVALLKEHTDATWRREECRRVLEAVGLSDAMHRKVKTLSGGTRQRVALATALIGSPELLVLDEPATGLDPDQRLRLRSVLSRAAASATVVLSTHNTAEVAALCQEVYVVLHGQVRFRGTPAELAAVADGQVWVDDREDSQALRCWQTADGTFRHLGVPPTGAEVIEPTLDDGYLLIAREGRSS